MRIARWWLAWLVVLLFVPANSPDRGEPAEPSGRGSACQPPFNVGFQVVTVSGRPRLATWYPTAEAAASFQYIPTVRGTVARGGSLSDCGRFPMVVFSHVWTGCATQSTFFTEELARHGYVVAAPDHSDALCSAEGTLVPRFIAPDVSFSRPDLWTDATYAARRDDVRRAIEWMLQADQFRSHVDSDRIGAVGHSLGGYTVIGLVGGWASWTDDRIKAALLFSPYAAPYVAQERLASVHVPVMYQAADGDVLITPSAVQRAYERSRAPKYYAQLHGGTHFDWTNLLCVAAATIANCLASRPNARSIDTYGFAFLDRYLKGRTEALQRLDGAGLADYRATP
jgi:predicted dienelactone hydrolase